MTPPADASGGGTRARRAAKQTGAVTTAPTSTAPPGTEGAAVAPATAPSAAVPAADRPATANTKPSAKSASRRRGAALDPDTLLAIEEERDFLLGSLDDLEREHDAGDVDDEDYDALLDDYTARAAAAIRALDDHAVFVRTARGDRSWMKVAAVLLVVAILGGAVGLFVANSSGERDPNGAVSGDIRSSSLGEIQKAKAFTGQAQQALQDGDSAKAVELYGSAIKAYGDALAIEPNNVEALTYKGWLLHNIVVQSGGAEASPEVAGLEASARESINQALAIKPTYADALVFRAVLAVRDVRPADALADLDALPEDSLPTAMQQLVDGVREDAEAQLAAGSSGSTTTVP